MTRKHYVRVAEILRDVKDSREKERLIGEFSQFFKEDNPRFSRARFVSACMEEE